MFRVMIVGGLAVLLSLPMLVSVEKAVGGERIIKELVIPTMDAHGNVISRKTVKLEDNKAPTKDNAAMDAGLRLLMKQLAEADKKKYGKSPKWPTSLHNHYLVSESGRVVKMVKGVNRLNVYMERPTKLSLDLGRKKGALVSVGIYTPKTGRFKRWESVILPPGLKSQYLHCSELFSWPDEYAIKNVIKPDGSVLDGVWEMYSLSEKGHCEVPLTNRNTCEAVGCSKYYGKRVKALLVKNRDQAVEMGRVKEMKDKNPLTYEKFMAKAHKPPKSSEPSKGYFDRGGACGMLSCDEVDNNQFIIDNYW